MQIIIDVAQSGDLRLICTARLAGSIGEGRRFSGLLELVAFLESLFSIAPHLYLPFRLEVIT